MSVTIDNNTVYKVDLKSSDNENKVIKWKVGERPRSLSINSECNLIVACAAVRRGEAGKIQEYNTTSGSLVREISLELKDVKLIHFTQYN
jgi:hypothetical protein